VFIGKGPGMRLRAAMQRVRAILARPRKVGQFPKSELIKGLEFLNRYRSSNEEIRRLFEWVWNKRMDYLFDAEKEQFTPFEKGETLPE
jgi:hypothetical protein